MRISTRSLFLSVVLASSLFSQTATDPNLGATLSYDDTYDIHTLAWWGVEDHTYFIQVTDDLREPWEYIPIIETGSDEVIEWGFHSNTDHFFLRLRYATYPVADPFNEDFDGDGVSNWDELLQGTDPFSNIDSDGDGMPDDYEIFHGTDPHDFFNGDTPRIILLEGGDQIVEPGETTATSLIVRITNSDGISLPNAPVTIELLNGSGELVQTRAAEATGHTTLEMRANHIGQIHPGTNPVYYRAPESLTPLPQYASIKVSSGDAELIVFAEVAETAPPPAPWAFVRTEESGGGFTISWHSQPDVADTLIYEERINGQWTEIAQLSYNNLTPDGSGTQYQHTLTNTFNPNNQARVGNRKNQQTSYSAPTEIAPPRFAVISLGKTEDVGRPHKIANNGWVLSTKSIPSQPSEHYRLRLGQEPELLEPIDLSNIANVSPHDWSDTSGYGAHYFFPFDHCVGPYDEEQYCIDGTIHYVSDGITFSARTQIDPNQMKIDENGNVYSSTMRYHMEVFHYDGVSWNRERVAAVPKWPYNSTIAETLFATETHLHYAYFVRLSEVEMGGFLLDGELLVIERMPDPSLIIPPQSVTIHGSSTPILSVNDREDSIKILSNNKKGDFIAHITYASEEEKYYHNSTEILPGANYISNDSYIVGHHEGTGFIEIEGVRYPIGSYQVTQVSDSTDSGYHVFRAGSNLGFRRWDEEANTWIPFSESESVVWYPAEAVIADTDWSNLVIRGMSPSGLLVGYATYDGEEHAVMLFEMTILADTNRDGMITAEDEIGKNEWNEQRGAIYNVNLDRDREDGINYPDAIYINDLGYPVFEDFYIQDGGDIHDITPFLIRMPFRQLENMTIWLRVKEEESLKAIHVFPYIEEGAESIKDSNDKYWGRAIDDGVESRETIIEITDYVFSEFHDGTRNPNHSGAKSNSELQYTQRKDDSVFGIEGLKFRNIGEHVISDLKFDGLVDFVLEVRIGEYIIFTDEIKMKVAPWVMTPPSGEVFASYSIEGTPLVSELPEIQPVQGQIDRWLQDHTEIGYTKRPGGELMKIALRIPQQNIVDLPGIPPSYFPNWIPQIHTGKNLGTYNFLLLNSDLNNHNQGGNIEVSEPLDNFPLGRIFVGGNPTERLKSFLTSQQIQYPLIGLNVSWLAVGHIDEVLSFLPDGTVLVSDSALGWNLLTDENGDALTTENSLFFARGESSDEYIVLNDSVESSSHPAYTIYDRHRIYIDGAYNESKHKDQFIRFVYGNAKNQVARISGGGDGYLQVDHVWWSGQKIMGLDGGSGNVLLSDYHFVSKSSSTISHRSTWFSGKYPESGDRFIVSDSYRWFSDNYTTSLPGIISLTEVIDDTDMNHFNSVTAKSFQDSIVSDLVNNGIPNGKIKRVPALYYQGRKDNETMKASGFNSLFVNLQVVESNIYTLPLLSPKTIEGDIFKEYLVDMFNENYEIHELDYWELYHPLWGGIHCGTYISRNPSNEQWWNSINN